MQPEGASAQPPPDRSRRWPPARRQVAFALIAAAILVAAIAVVPLVAGASWSLIAHYECGPGATVATRDLWTPEVLVNSPYGGFGNGTGTYPIPGGSTSTSIKAANGEATAEFVVEEWSIAPSVRVLVAGPGANAICTGFVAAGKVVGGYTGAILLLRGATSDAGENTSLSYPDPYGNQYDSVRFQNGYSEGDLTFSSCGGGGLVMAARASRIAIEVPFTLDGQSYTASAAINAAFNYTYLFPGNFGTWSIDDLNTGTHAPGGGWAFSFTPCP